MIRAPLIPTQHLPHIVIIGAGFGGLECARALRRVDARITIIDRSNHHLFQPLLYQVATAGLSPGDIASPIRVVTRGMPHVNVIMGQVTDIDPDERKVYIESGIDLQYDHLVVATGAAHSYFGNDHWSEFAPGLKTIADATNIRKKILLAFEAAELERDPEKKKALLTMIVVGGGPTGVEMAGSIAEMSRLALRDDFKNFDPSTTRILLIEAAPRILNQFPDDLAQKAQQHLAKLGVEVMLSKRVEDIDAEGVVVSGERIGSNTVIWAAGVKASPAGEWLKAEMDKAGRVIVGGDLTIKGRPEVFVIGDTAASLDENGKLHPGVAPVAMQQGRYVAQVLKERLSGDKITAPFRYKDKGSMATVGRAFAIVLSKKLKLSGAIAWLAWLFIHIMYLVGFRSRFIVIFQWIWAYITYQRGVRLIVGEDVPEPKRPAPPPEIPVTARDTQPAPQVAA